MSDETTQQPAEPAPAPPAPTPEQEAADKQARAIASIGAQVMLDPESDAALAACGGYAATMEENAAALIAALPAEVRAGTMGGVVKGKLADSALHRLHGADAVPAVPPEAAA